MPLRPLWADGGQSARLVLGPRRQGLFWCRVLWLGPCRFQALRGVVTVALFLRRARIDRIPTKSCFSSLL